MSRKLLDSLLAGTLRDPDGSGLLSVPVQSVVIARDLARQAGQLVAPLGFGKRIAVVMDKNTRGVMGEAVSQALRGAHEVNEIVFDHSPHPDMDAVAFARERTGADDAVIGVGSGSINDIAKYTAHLQKKPYAVFGTAPSMNGYTSVAAALTEDGLKKSLPSTAPRGVFLDLSVLARAPRRLIAAGIGDSVCRATAQVDWLMAHRILGTKYREAPFMLLKEDENELLPRIGEMVAGNEDAIELLARTLVMSGFGMTICGGSYPASQGEHLIAHYIDMLGQNLPLAYHGEHIAVTTMTMARLHEKLLAQDRLTVVPSTDTRDQFVAHFGESLGRECWAAWLAKRIDAERAASLNRKLASDWNDIRAELKTVGRSSAQIGSALTEAGAPTTPQAAGIPVKFYEEAVLNARKIRDRFTSLDLAAATGHLT